MSILKEKERQVEGRNDQPQNIKPTSLCFLTTMETNCDDLIRECSEDKLKVDAIEEEEEELVTDFSSMVGDKTDQVDEILFNPKAITAEGNMDGLLVIGAGLSRTGTRSLKKALEILYGKRCYHASEMIAKHKDHFNIWFDILEKMQEDPEFIVNPDIIRTLFAGYHVVTDQPASILYRQLMNIYPNAKVSDLVGNQLRMLILSFAR